MTLQNLFSTGPRERAADARSDSVTLIVVALLGLVFAPILGLHFALAAVDPGAAAPASAVTTDAGRSPSEHPAIRSNQADAPRD
ncbi:hypothetical protein [Blastochloris sulfoviridis]|uniref:Uncharacterized protein n=1 Tax=Blastochloris sulfoviridis TaxID=50712 RepID=A0A5M6I2P1_9HYPH|nr:hypothetical protein [Blastochloris sulfoviridis]KAA5602471.1 hypothetical protein F1193_04690 [Blastochloris sulfoviridis]